MIGRYSPSVYTVAGTSLFGVPSIVFVNTDKGGTWGVTNEPGNQRWSPANLQGAQKPFCHLGHGRRSAAIVLRCLRTCWKELSTKSEGEKKTYRIMSLLRLSSSTSSGLVSKRVSSPTIRARRFSIFSPMVAVSCRCVSKRGFARRGRKRTSRFA
jgi:hypothetical protein